LAAGSVPLTSAADQESSAARLATELLLLGTVSLLLLSLLWRGVWFLGTFWPEVFLLLAALGVSAWGLSPVGLGLIAVALLVRTARAARALRRIMKRWFHPPPPEARSGLGAIP
jgi:hypothetical protein